MRCHSCSGQPSGLFVSENDGRPSRQRNKTHKGEETYLRFARGDETRLLGLRKTARSDSGGLNAETRTGGIEPMGKISLLTFLFIGLPGLPVIRPESKMLRALAGVIEWRGLNRLCEL